MSAASSFVRRASLPLTFVALLASGAGCSSAGDALEIDQGYGPGHGLPGENEGESEQEDDAEPGGAGDDGGGDEGGGMDDAPPAPDDQGVDNASDPQACDAQADVTLYLSPDDSNSMSSPVQAREAALGDWASVQSIAIRTWEFFNYYHFGYPEAQPGTVAVHPSLLPSPLGTKGEYLLQLGISSERLTPQTRPPVNVTLVLDTSGSMAGRPMDMLRESCRAIASSLREGDTVSMVTWNTENAVVLGGLHVDGPDDPTLLSTIDALEHGGGTDLNGGLQAGYALAEQVYDADAINRVVLVSDGGANAGVTDIDLIAEHAGHHDEDGIYLVGVGVGDALGYHDHLMDAVTDTGKGASVFIASADEAWSTFGDGFISTMGVAARDVQVQLDLPPGFEVVSTSAEELSTDASEVEPQHLAPNDAMVFHQRIRTCAPELFDPSATVTVTVRYLDALTFDAREVVSEATFEQLLAADPTPLLKGAAVFAYAESLKAYKHADHDGRGATTNGAFEALEAAEAALPADPELAEIRGVLETLAQ